MRRVLVILLLFFSVFCSKTEDQAIPDITDQEEIPDQEIWNSEYRWTKNGQNFVIVKYGHLRKYENKKELLLDDSLITDFFKNGEHASILRSREGKIDENTNDMTAFGNVKVVSDSGIILYTQELHWKNKIEKISTDKFVTIITDLDTIYGYGFESDQELKNWEIKNVRGKSKRTIKLE